MWWKPALSPAEVLWSSGFRVIEPSSQTIRVSWRIAALPPSTAPSGPLGSPPSRSTPSHRHSLAPFGMFRPAPAVLGVRVCSKTSIVVKTPDSRSARAVISPAMPPPAISARKKALQFPCGVRPRERRTPPATVARNHREGNVAARRRNPPRARSIGGRGHPTISALEAWELLGAKPEHRPKAGAAPASDRHDACAAGLRGFERLRRFVHAAPARAAARRRWGHRR